MFSSELQLISQTEHCLLLDVVHHDEARLRLEGQITNVVVVHDNGSRLAVVTDGPQMVVNVEVAHRVLTDLLQQRRVGSCAGSSRAAGRHRGVRQQQASPVAVRCCRLRGTSPCPLGG